VIADLAAWLLADDATPQVSDKRGDAGSAGSNPIGPSGPDENNRWDRHEEEP
jgi:hypothetical protein